jgi:hypothetical protein
MTRQIRQWSVAIFLFGAFASNAPTLKATDCTDFYTGCDMFVAYPNFVYGCDSRVDCFEVNDCLEEACPNGTWDCDQPCAPSGGACGAGVCE